MDRLGLTGADDVQVDADDNARTQPNGDLVKSLRLDRICEFDLPAGHGKSFPVHSTPSSGRDERNRVTHPMSKKQSDASNTAAALSAIGGTSP